MYACEVSLTAHCVGSWAAVQHRLGYYYCVAALLDMIHRGRGGEAHRRIGCRRILHMHLCSQEHKMALGHHLQPRPCMSHMRCIRVRLLHKSNPP